MITELQKKQILQQGMPLDKVEEQIRNFVDGFPFLKIGTPATPGRGIRVLSEEDLEEAVNTYQQLAPERVIVKFVPASGAASRMFKDLYAFLESGKNDLGEHPFVDEFITKLPSFAFYENLNERLKQAGTPIKDALEKHDYQLIVSHLLDPEGLGYGQLPKGLLKFHRYDDESRTPVHEHFVEGAQYGLGKGNTVRLHFTVSPEHQQKFEDHISEIRPDLEEEFGVRFDISFSQQKKSTDTIAVNMDNTPFTEDDGEILFRPAGHGALLENLNEIDADLVYIKNIDNVVPDRLKETTTIYKKAIGGVLLNAQNNVFDILHRLDGRVDEATVSAADQVLRQTFDFKLPDKYSRWSLKEKAAYLRKKLDRPIRVCGMVENTGEPGGGPFWVLEEDGSSSLQIAETAQLNLEDEGQKKLFQASSHFNPTDLVCGLKDYQGNKFDLMKYRDPKTGFITQKSKNGKPLKAQELPGLWNGSMSDWNSIFVEVPLITFNPVKTVNDLLRDVHQ